MMASACKMHSSSETSAGCSLTRLNRGLPGYPSLNNLQKHGGIIYRFDQCAGGADHKGQVWLVRDGWDTAGQQLQMTSLSCFLWSTI